MIQRPEVQPPVVVERRLSHPPEAVFALWRDPGSVREWMAPAPGVSVVEIDWPFQIGQAYRLVMDVDGEAVTFRGEFLEIVHRERLVFTWLSSRTDETETRVTVEFSGGPSHTLLRLTHELLPSVDAAGAHRAGWQRILAELDAAADERLR